ncbi:MAG: SOS response-associated peptidase [Gemmataceae bacterium]
MCYRFTLASDPIQIAEFFELIDVPGLVPRYNIAPRQLISVVGRKNASPARGIVNMVWGFVPRWSPDATSGPRPMNARSETVRTSPAFRDSFRDRRCLVPADGFYEWEDTPDGKQPWHFRRPDRAPFAFAGIWDVWKGADRPLYSAAILTTTPNDVVRPLHDRMPVVIPRERYSTWLDPKSNPEELQSILKPADPDFFIRVAVKKTVNKVTVEGPQLLEAA